MPDDIRKIIILGSGPAGLTAALYYFGMKAREARTLGGFAYLAVSIVLAGFSVFAINQYWLARAIPEPVCLTLAAAVSTAFATGTDESSNEWAVAGPDAASVSTAANTTERGWITASRRGRGASRPRNPPACPSASAAS